MIRLLQSSSTAALVGSVLYLGTTVALLDPAEFQGARAVVEANYRPDNNPSWKFRNPEFDQWVAELKREKEALAAREQELRVLQTRLEVDRAEIYIVTQTVAQMQAEFDKTVVRFKAQEMENLKREAKIIAGMSPEGAAAMLNAMPDSQVARVLALMKPDFTSAFLDALSKMGKAEAERAASLTELLRRTLPPAPPTKSG